MLLLTLESGKTWPDVLIYLFEKTPLLVFISIVVVATIVITAGFMIAHPNRVREWNAFFYEKIARIAPKKRKKAFESKLNNTLEAVYHLYKTPIKWYYVTR